MKFIIRNLQRGFTHSSTLNQTTGHKIKKVINHSNKFINLASQLQQRSLGIIKNENIKIDLNLQNQKLKINANENLNKDEKKIRSRRKIRKNFEEDDSFLFERKRGKRHIMIALKQSKSNPANHLNQSEQIHLSPELNLNFRFDGELNKVLIELPTSLSKNQHDSSSTSLIDKSSTQDQNLNQINEFIEMYLGPLVWSNPQVDISLVYNQDQDKPKISFWYKEQVEEEKNNTLLDEKKTSVKQVDIDASMNKSDILQLILNH